MRIRGLLSAVMFSLLLPNVESIAACQSSIHPLIRKVIAYHEAQERGDKSAAKNLFAQDSRIWYEKKEGPGAKRNGGEGPWAEWDRYFKARAVYYEYRAEDATVAFRLLETNDFYRLIDRPPSRVQITYYFNREEKIDGTLVEAVESGAKDRMAEFKEWASRNRPEELKYLMPEGKIVPSLERARRWRAILDEWRAAAGLPPIT